MILRGWKLKKPDILLSLKCGSKSPEDMFDDQVDKACRQLLGHDPSTPRVIRLSQMELGAVFDERLRDLLCSGLIP